jgi:hypothetical protein
MIQARQLANTALLLAAISLSSGGAMADPIAEEFTGPAVTVDFCEVDRNGIVHVGGKVGPDSKREQPVFVSRGATQLLAAPAVNNNGTFEGSTVGSDLRAGDLVTVSIRPKGGQRRQPCSVHTPASPHLTMARRLVSRRR